MKLYRGVLCLTLIGNVCVVTFYTCVARLLAVVVEVAGSPDICGVSDREEVVGLLFNLLR